MSSNYDEVFDQQMMILNQLEGEAKKEFYINLFVFGLVQSLVKKRKEQGISQLQLAKLMGVKQSYLSRVENLIKTPTIETIAKYCFALDVPVGDLNQSYSKTATNESIIKEFTSFKTKTNKSWGSKAQRLNVCASSVSVL